MATKIAAASVPFGAVFTLRVGYVLDNVYQGFASWNDNRKTVKALGALTDAQLEDIGLVRGDLNKL